MEAIIRITGRQFSKKELIIASEQLIFWIVEVIFFSIFQRPKAVNKRILFPLNKNYDSTSQNEGFDQKIHFHYAENLLSPAGIYKKRVENGFQ